jgi:Ala-tRNA(Pro) deacylase
MKCDLRRHGGGRRAHFSRASIAHTPHRTGREAECARSSAELTPPLGRIALHRPATMDLAAFLAHHGIDAKRFEHLPVMTVEESKRLVPELPGAKTKNLFLRDKKGARHVLLTVAHDIGVDLNSLGLLLGTGRLGFASPERLRKYLGVAPGAVSLLALANDAARAVEFVLDRRLWEADAVQAHPLVNDATMVLPHAQLERFLAATGHAAHIVDVPGRRES